VIPFKPNGLKGIKYISINVRKIGRILYVYKHISLINLALKP